MNGLPDKAKGIIAIISIWLATIYTAPEIHSFLENGSGGDGSTQWPPRDVFEALRVLLLAIVWVVYTAFIALAITVFILVAGIIWIPIWVAISTYGEARRKKRQENGLN